MKLRNFSFQTVTNKLSGKYKNWNLEFRFRLGRIKTEKKETELKRFWVENVFSDGI